MMALSQMFRTVSLFPAFRMPTAEVVERMAARWWDRKANLPGGGWVGNDLSARPAPPTVSVGLWSVAGLAVGVKKAPASLVKAELVAAYRKELAAGGSLSRATRKLIKENVTKALDAQAQFRLAWVPVAWREGADMLLVGSGSTNALDALVSNLIETLGRDAIGEWRVASSMAQMAAGPGFAPTAFSPDAEETVDLGPEFCTYLLYSLLEGDAPPATRPGWQFMVETPLRLETARGQVLTIKDQKSNQWVQDVRRLIAAGHVVTSPTLTGAHAGLYGAVSARFDAEALCLKSVKVSKYDDDSGRLDATIEAALAVWRMVDDFLKLRKTGDWKQICRRVSEWALN